MSLSRTSPAGMATLAEKLSLLSLPQETDRMTSSMVVPAERSAWSTAARIERSAASMSTTVPLLMPSER